MKKFGFLLSFLMMALCVGFTSCSDDDDEKGGQITGSIVGTWQTTWSKGYGYDKIYNESDKWDEAYTEDIFVFNSNGTGCLYDEEDYYEDEEDYHEDFTWTLSGRTLTIVYGDEDEDDIEKYYVNTLSGSTLVIIYHEKDENEEEYDEISLRRIK